MFPALIITVMHCFSTLITPTHCAFYSLGDYNEAGYVHWTDRLSAFHYGSVPADEWCYLDSYFAHSRQNKLRLRAFAKRPSSACQAECAARLQHPFPHPPPWMLWLMTDLEKAERGDGNTEARFLFPLVHVSQWVMVWQSEIIQIQQMLKADRAIKQL